MLWLDLKKVTVRSGWQLLKELATGTRHIPVKRLLKRMLPTEDFALTVMNTLGIKDLNVYTAVTTVVLDLGKST